MKSLQQYVKDGLAIIDCHVHLFGLEGEAKYPKPIDQIVCMVENDLKDKDKSLMQCYGKFIPTITPGRRICCVGSTPKETIDIYEKYRNHFNAFGEVKCYKHGKFAGGEEFEHFDTSILDVTVGKGLPVFIHWDLNGKHDQELFDYIKTHPQTTFVLCHCGINDIDDPNHAFNIACEYQSKLMNLWLSISWVALDYLSDNMTLISNVSIPDHTIVGTDFNGRMNAHGVDFNDRYDKFRRIYNRFDVPVAINNLFA